MPISLDETDISILKILQSNAKVTIKDMAQTLNLSTTPIFERIKKLERLGIILKTVAILDRKQLGKHLNVFINISIKEHGKDAINKFVEEIISFPEVIECHHISGDSDFLVKLIVEDIESYNTFIQEKLSVIPNLGKVQSRFSLSERKNTTVIPL